MSLYLKFDPSVTARLLDKYRGDVTQLAVSRALNRTATTVRAAVAREIAPEVGLGINVVRKSILITRSTPATLVAIVAAGGSKRIPLGKLKAVETRKGVRVRIGGKSIVIPQAFIPEGKPRKRVVIRAADFRGQMFDQVHGRRKRVQKTGMDLPIAEIFAPGIPTIFINKRILRVAERVAVVRFPEALKQEIRFAATRRQGA